MKMQLKITFNGIHKSFDNYDSYTFKHNEVLMDKPIYLGYAVLELSKLLMYETYYDELQPYLGEKDIQSHFMNTYSFVFSIKRLDVIEDLYNLKDILDFSKINKILIYLAMNNGKVVGQYNFETPLKILG